MCVLCYAAAVCGVEVSLKSYIRMKNYNENENEEKYVWN